MEIPFRSATVSTIVHATEDEQRVHMALKTLLPEGVEIRGSKLRGHHGNPIINFEARVERRWLRELLGKMVAKLRAGGLDVLEQIAPERIDENCCFYLRFDKQLAYSGELVPSEGGDAIHLKLKVASFPAKREVAIERVKRFLEERRSGL